jgi:hypothetical protein
VFWSIISDYDLRAGLCELVDNALDLWITNERKRPLTVKLTLDADRQLISVADNAGGVSEADLKLLISPGGSSNSPHAPIIGVFGVGSKRASVALGEQVELRTRFEDQGTFQIDITREWLETEEWEIPSYAIPSIEPYTTKVDISRLRRTFDKPDIDRLRNRLGEIYSWFIDEGCVIEVNGVPIFPIKFDKFAFPPEYRPQRATFPLHVEGFGEISAAITAGLIVDRDPETENYGVYLYCNHRLVVKELKVRDVGYFVGKEAGVPHPDASLARVIIQLEGAARAMPWNSIKSGIDFAHPAFLQLRPTVIQLNTYFSSLSRRLKNDWGGKVFAYKTGAFDDVEPPTPGAAPRFVMAPLPRVNKSRLEYLKQDNKPILDEQPWTLGLVEAMSAAQEVLKKGYDTKNRIALILLDSNFEIALKEFIVHRTDLFPTSQYTDTTISKLFNSRGDVVKDITAKVPALQSHIAKASHFYLMRNKIIHERASVSPTSNDVDSYRQTVEAVLNILFGLSF